MEKIKFEDFVADKDYTKVYYFLKDIGLSENYITNLRKVSGYILINGKVATMASPLKANDVLSINSSPNDKTNVQPCDIPLDIVFEDEHLLIVNKPSGLSCMPNRSHYTNNLAGAICHYMRKADNFTLRILNRLDKDTAGLIIVAKDSIAYQKIKNIDKTYFALCKGKIDTDIEINKNILTLQNNGINEQKRIVSEDGKPAITYVKPVIFNQKYSLIKAKIQHGRTHQIRVHLSSIGYPLLGDELYGEKSEIISHTALVCKEISFVHPITLKSLNFTIPFPTDFQAAINEIFK